MASAAQRTASGLVNRGITIQCTGVAVRAESQINVAGGNPVIVVVSHNMTLDSLAQLLKQLGAPDAAVTLTIAGAIVFVLHQLMKLRREIHSLRIEQDTHHAQQRKQNRAEILEALKQLEELKESSLSPEQLDGIRTAILNTVPGLEAPAQKQAVTKSVDEVTPSQKGDNQDRELELYELHGWDKVHAIFGKLFLCCFLLVWGLGWGSAIAATGGIFAIQTFQSGREALTAGSIGSGVGLTFLGLAIIVVVFGLGIVPSAAALYGSVVAALEISSAIFSSARLQAAVRWMKGIRNRVAKGTKMPIG